MKRRPWFVRALLLAGLTLAAALALALGVLLFAAHTPWGRESVRLIALWQLRPRIAGELELGEISRLNGTGLGLRRLRARARARRTLHHGRAAARMQRRPARSLPIRSPSANSSVTNTRSRAARRCWRFSPSKAS